MPPKIGQRGTAEERFWAKVDKSSECWFWTGYTYAGYGRFSVSPARKAALAHRFAYELMVGPIPIDCELDHLCRTPACVRPTHLEAVSRQINVLRGNGPSARAARRNICLYGHPMDGRTKRSRYCKTCKRVAYYREWEKNKRLAREYQQRKANLVKMTGDYK